MKNRRRKLFIDRPVQGAIARRITLHWILFFFILFFTLPFWRLCYRADLSAPFSTLLLQGLAETAPVFVLLLATLPMFIWDTVKLSHRFAGPMYRLQKALQDLAAGDEPSPIRLRKGDFWKDVADDFNAMLDRLAREESEERRLAVEETDPAMTPACAPSEP
jgi:methyl-accepting chemotaxis protein